MAVRISGAGQKYTATNGLPTNVYTFCAWVRPATVGSGNRVVFWLTASGDVFTGIEVRSTLNELQGYDSSTYAFNGLGPLVVSAGTWYRCALVINGSNATFYRAAAGSALGSASVSDFTVSSSPATWYIGDDPYDEYFDGRIAAVKAWSAALTQAEVELELGQYAPVRLTNLLRFHPFLKAETTDYSGAANSLSNGTGATTEDGPPIPWRTTTPRLIVPAASGAAPVTLGQAVETDTAAGLARTKSRAVGLATETDTGQALTRTKSRALTQAAEADTATAWTRSKLRSIGLTSEADTATSLARTKSRPVGQATEADTASALSTGSTIVLGQAVETNAATPVGRSKACAIGQAAEANTAASITRTKLRALGAATETDTAAAMSRTKVRALALVAETGTAMALARTKLRALGVAVEFDQALAFVSSGIAWPPTAGDPVVGDAYTAGAPSVTNPYTAADPIVHFAHTANTPTVS